MSFGFVPWALGALGLVGIAGVLYALQRLRVRHRQVEVETTLFWQQAIEESRARVLTQRFRHPWTYALLLVICSLLWLSFCHRVGHWQCQFIAFGRMRSDLSHQRRAGHTHLTKFSVGASHASIRKVL